MTLSHAQLNPTPTDTHIYTDIFTICTRHGGWGCGQILKSHRIRSIHLLTFSHSTNQAQQLSFPKALISLHTSPIITLSITYCNYPFICPYHPCSAHLLDHLCLVHHHSLITKHRTSVNIFTGSYFTKRQRVMLQTAGVWRSSGEK